MSLSFASRRLIARAPAGLGLSSAPTGAEPDESPTADSTTVTADDTSNTADEE